MTAAFRRPRLDDPRVTPTVDVEIDWSHPLAVNLIGCWVPTQGFRNLAEKSLPLTDSGGAFPPQVSTAIGQAWSQSNGVSGLYLTAPAPFTTGSQFGLFWKGWRLGSEVGGSEAILVGVSYDTTDTSPYISYDLDTGYQGATIAGRIGTNDTPLYSPPLLTICSAGATFGPASGGWSNLYANGSFFGGASGMGVPAFGTAPQITIGGYLGNTTRSPNYATNIALFYTGTMGDSGAGNASMMAWLDAEPFAMLVPKVARTYYVVSSSMTLFARSTAGAAAKPGAAAATALRARSIATASARPAMMSSAHLAAVAAAVAQMKASAAATATLGARSAATSSGKAAAKASAFLAGRAVAASAGRAGIAALAALAARALAQSAARPALNSHLVLIAGRAQALSSGMAAAAHAAYLKVLSLATSVARGGLYAPPPIKPVGKVTPPTKRRSYVPFMPPITPNVLPEGPFDALIENYGLSFLWVQAHQCPCVNSGEIIGSADPSCGTCKGVGVYWDHPVGPWMGLLTFMHMSPSPDEQGVATDASFGMMMHGEPTLTIPYSAASGVVWENASVYDAFVEQNALARYSAQLVVGGVMAVPYQQGLAIEPTGAVTVWDPVAKVATPVVGYTVNGGTVTLPPQYPTGTAYNVEFQANPVYIAYRKAGGMPHVRPFGGGQVNLPRRFRVQPLDLWTRARQGYPDGTTPQAQRT